MQSADKHGDPVRARAALVDPASMTVVWMNESASGTASTAGDGSASGVSIDQVVPMAEALGVPEVLRVVADTGVPQHLRTALVSTSKGSMAMVVSVYRLPDGMLLVLTDNTFQAAPRTRR